MEYEDQRTIATPEGVQLALPLAGLGTRFLAIMIDSLIGGAVALVVIVAAAVAAGGVGASIASASALLVFFIGYHVVFEAFGGGRTIGKRAAHLRVVMDGGEPVGLRASLIRNILRLLEIPLFYLPAIVCVLATRNNQRLGDVAAGTLVIRETRVPDARFAPPPPPQVPAQRIASWDVAGIGEADATAVRAFLERRWGFEPKARAALANQLAQRLRPQVPGARPGLSDEAFLEHLAAAKSRASSPPDGG
jgi:uncharacterized RDD family membrane protein YckC